MKKTKLCLVGLIFVLAFTQITVTGSDVSSYDFMADVNRDGIVDVNDLAELGEAYGSSLVLPSENNRTVVIVVSFDKEPPEVENARVAIVDPNALDNQRDNPINVTHTNSSGIATFELGNNKNYTAIAWSGSAYNYANFTTNTSGEASILILLGEPLLPLGWIVVTLLDNTTGSFYCETMRAQVHRIEFSQSSYRFFSEVDSTFNHYGGVFVIPPNLGFNEPYSKWRLWIFNINAETMGTPIYSPDENGCANVVVYVNPA